MKNQNNDNKISIDTTTTNDKSQVKNLDDLIELLDQDALRHVVGGRPKGKPTSAA